MYLVLETHLGRQQTLCSRFTLSIISAQQGQYGEWFWSVIIWLLGLLFSWHVDIVVVVVVVIRWEEDIFKNFCC